MDLSWPIPSLAISIEKTHNKTCSSLVRHRLTRTWKRTSTCSFLTIQTPCLITSPTLNKYLRPQQLLSNTTPSNKTPIKSWLDSSMATCTRMAVPSRRIRSHQATRLRPNISRWHSIRTKTIITTSINHRCFSIHEDSLSSSKTIRVILRHWHCWARIYKCGRTSNKCSSKCTQCRWLVTTQTGTDRQAKLKNSIIFDN